VSIKALLFDKDGTLIDFDQTWLPAYQRAIKLLVKESHRGINARQLLLAGGYETESQSWRADSLLASGSNVQIFKHWEELTGLSLKGDLLAELNDIFSAKTLSYQPTVPNVIEFFDALRKQKYILGIATMDDCQHAADTLRALGVYNKFDFICGADSGFGEKPAPGMMHAFAHHCGLAMQQIAMIGDSPRDLQMAHNAGAGCAIGVLTGASERSDLLALAHHILPDIGALPSLLERL